MLLWLARMTRESGKRGKRWVERRKERAQKVSIFFCFSTAACEYMCVCESEFILCVFFLLAFCAENLISSYYKYGWYVECIPRRHPILQIAYKLVEKLVHFRKKAGIFAENYSHS